MNYSASSFVIFNNKFDEKNCFILNLGSFAPVNSQSKTKLLKFFPLKAAQYDLI